MKNQETTKILPMSEETIARIRFVAARIKDKDLFPERVATAKKTLSKLKSLPV